MSGRYRVGAAARLAGLPPNTLRVWERRYGPFASLRSPGGNRLYADADVERLALLKKLVDEGHAIGPLAPLRTPALSRIATRYHGERALPASMVASAARGPLLSAVRGMETRLLDDLFSRAALALPPRELLESIVAPLFTEVGRAWKGRRLGIAHEHAATAVARAHLASLLRSYRPAASAAAVVAATPEGELHELGALGAALVAAHAGFRVVYLGPSVPAADLAAAARESAAFAVVLSCVAPARRQLQAARAALPAGVALLVGGPAGAVPLASLERELLLASRRRARARRVEDG